eukprot:EG_transcript_4348
MAQLYRISEADLLSRQEVIKRYVEGMARVWQRQHPGGECPLEPPPHLFSSMLSFFGRPLDSHSTHVITDLLQVLWQDTVRPANPRPSASPTLAHGMEAPPPNPAPNPAAVPPQPAKGSASSDDAVPPDRHTIAPHSTMTTRSSAPPSPAPSSLSRQPSGSAEDSLKDATVGHVTLSSSSNANRGDEVGAGPIDGWPGGEEAQEGADNGDDEDEGEVEDQVEEETWRPCRKRCRPDFFEVPASTRRPHQPVTSWNAVPVAKPAAIPVLPLSSMTKHARKVPTPVTPKLSGPFAQAIFPHLRLLEARLRTFWCWSGAGCVVSGTVNPDTLAAAGFFHAPNSDHMDRTACFYCGEVLCDWQPDDVPRAEHRREMPRCHFARCGAWLSRRLGPGPGGVRSPGTPRRAALRGTTSVNAQPPSAATGGHLVAAVGRARRRAAQGRSVAVSGDQPSAPAVGRRERRASSSPVAGAASPAAPCEQRRREEPAPKRRGRPRKVAAAPRGACLMAKEADDGRATEPLPERKRHGLDRKEENGGLPTKRRRVSSEQRSTRQDTGRDTASKGKPVKHRLAVPPLHEQVPRQQLALERRALCGLSARAQRRLGPRRPGEAEAAYLRRFRELVALRAHALQKRSIADWRRRVVREMWECQPELNAPQFLAMGERGRATYVRNRRRYQSLLRRVQVWAGNLAPRLS